MRFHRFVVVSACLVIAAAASAAAPAPPAAGTATAKPVKLLPVPKERAVVSHHHVVIDGQRIAYTATAGTLLLYNAKHQPTASVFYIAYARDGVHDAAARPVTFAYNGGPGFASALVDIGGFGPRRIVWPAPGDSQAQQPPYRLVNNDDSILKTSDLVFIDAIGTGYSRLAGAGTPKMFYGISGDASAYAQFIQRYITRFDRWNSPKFLLGESYGTTRSAVLAQDLVAKGVYVNGVILCSTVLDLPTINFSAGNDLPYVLYLPSYAAVAWYHHRLQPQPANLQAAVSAAEQFAGTDYQQALFEGSALAPAQRSRIAAHLSRLTGIPAALWLRADLRMTLPVFMRRLLGASESMTGRYDARYTAPELQPLLPVPGRGDAGATTTAIWGALAASFDHYLRDDLHYTST
ncbi:MAG: peptidase S10, partial [Xanthomonadaceae bacterium]|nr:peptidase S10 [Xanthomonadaceae bacterium]